MSDVICIVAFRTDTDRAVRYKKIQLKSEEDAQLVFKRVAAELLKAWIMDNADFVSIRFIRQTKAQVKP